MKDKGDGGDMIPQCPRCGGYCDPEEYEDWVISLLGGSNTPFKWDCETCEESYEFLQEDMEGIC